MESYRYAGSELELFAHAVNWKSYWSSVLLPFVGDRVLDVGAGIGATAAAMNMRDFSEWVALEPDSELAGRILDTSRLGALPRSLKVIVGTTADLDPDQQFDTILYVDVLEHIEDDAAELARAASHLSPRGRMIILAPAHNWLFTPFDQAIGHFRRYDRHSLSRITPSGFCVSTMRYLDSVGMLASLANRVLLKSAQPTLGQIRLWDRAMVPCSRVLDKLTFGRVGKTIMCVMESDSLLRVGVRS